MYIISSYILFFFFFQAEDGIRDYKVTGVQTCALPIFVGLVIFVNGTVTSWYKYPIMLAATITGLALIYHIKSLGAATRWEKAVVVYGTIVVVAYFILTSKRPARRNNPPSSPQPPARPPQE